MINTLEDKQLLNKLGINIFDKKRSYWFIRTQSGMYYDDFTNENYVGIEWDEISDLDFIKSATEEEWKSKILSTYKDVEKPGYIMNQIKRFVIDIKAGDIVLIPNEKSRWLAIGEVIDDSIEIYEEDMDFDAVLDSLDECETKANKTIMKKRRRIKWLKEFKRSEWDPYLQGIIHSNSAVISADKYDIYIDRMLSQFYIKGDQAYFTYKVNKKDNIPYRDMLSFLNNNNKLIEFFNENYPELNLEIDDLILKINVQSKGPVQFKGTVKTILISGLIIGALFGTKFDFKFLGLDLSIETEGLPALIKSVSEAINNIRITEKESELQEIINNFNKDKEKLEIEVPNLENKLDDPIAITTEEENIETKDEETVIEEGK